jgi:predicted Zn-dependent protease
MKYRQRQLSTLLLCAALAFPTPAAPDLPDLGDVAADEFSPLQERKIGEEIMRQIRHDPAWLDDPLVEEYIDRLGRRLVAVSQDPLRPFDFFVLKDPTLNAFALPGGHVGIHTGLILAAESESELAGVLGHEIAHVTQRHIAQIVGKQNQSSMLMLASMLVAVLAANSNSQLGEAAMAAGTAGTLQAQLGYSRDFEREADRVGLQTLEAAGFDVRGMAGFFVRLQRESRLYENKAPAYLRTHPLTTERISDMENRVGAMHYRQAADSMDFRLVRARLRARLVPAAEALRTFAAFVDHHPDDPVPRYGLAVTQLRLGKLDEASRSVEDLRRSLAEPSPFVELLAAEIALGRHDGQGAARTLEAASRRFPASMSIVYALAEARIAAGASATAAESLRRSLAGRGGDIRLWALLARAQAAQGKRTAQHRAQAEVYALQGGYPAALEQLELARKADDGDFYELSAVDARLREVREQVREARREQREAQRGER